METIKDTSPITTHTAQPPTPPADTGAKQTVIIAEDEDSIRVIYKEYLEMNGYTVLEARDGAEALKLATTEHFDIMLLDIMMPNMTGLDVLEEMAKDTRMVRKKVYILTVLGRDTVIKEAFDLGATGYFVKDRMTPEDVLVGIRGTA